MKRLLVLLLLAASPAHAGGWTDFHAIMWQPQTAAGYRALHRLGVDAGKSFGFRGPVVAAEIPARLAPLTETGTRFYLENLATDFYAPYHRWTPDHPSVTWLFEQTKARYRANPADPTVFFRTPSLSDPAWRARIAARLTANARAFAPYRPLFYNLGDETGIADLSAAWDFDRSPPALAAFRAWLRTRYPSLAALNAEWSTAFPAWDSVMPATTTEALARTDGNFAAWADFKTFMDHAFAAALRSGTDALHQGDPDALSAIEGTQAPGPGGYDYIRLARAVDLMEMYGAGDSVDIARSFNPDLAILITIFGDAQDQRRLWHSLLQGGRGVVIWDDRNDFVDGAGRPSPRARALAPLLHELHAGLGAQLIATRAERGPVAILYSPLSQHLQWLEDRRADPKPWTDRTAESEWQDDNRMRRSIHRAVQSLVQLGLPPHFVSAEALAGGLLSGAAAPRVLLLPQSVALPAAAVAAIARFAAGGGLVLADGPAGAYDGHGRRLPRPSLATLAPPHIATLRETLAQAGIRPDFTITAADGQPARGIAIRVLRTGATRIIALEHTAAAGATRLTLTLAAPAALHDLRHGTTLPHATRIAVTLGPDAPALIAVAPNPSPGLSLAGPVTARPGTTLHWRLALDPPAHHSAHALRLRLLDPGGKPAHTGVRVLTGDSVDWTIQLPPEAPRGKWRLEATDILTGRIAMRTVEVEDR